MKFLAAFLFVASATLSYAQEKKNYYGIWSFHERNSNIYGLSVGLWTGPAPRQTATNGIRLEAVGAGIILPMGLGTDPVAHNDTLFAQHQKNTISETVNGMNLSASGTVCHCTINGVNMGLISHLVYKVNGFSAAIILNYTQVHRGIQVSFSNGTYIMRGMQIGIMNSSRKSKGVQIGIWNVNEKRKWPIINWNF